MSAPAPDQLEVSLFGPGYGECTLIHIGSGKWIIVDSCSQSSVPVALKYLREIGVDARSSVVSIVVTHWHDDHVRGISKLIEECPTADVVLPAAMSGREFIEMVHVRDSIQLTNVSTGVGEIRKGRRRASPSTRLYRHVIISIG